MVAGFDIGPLAKVFTLVTSAINILKGTRDLLPEGEEKAQAKAALDEAEAELKGMEVPEELVVNVRMGIIGLLRLYASPEEQIAYPCPVEYLHMWFDDLYHPDTPAHHQAFSAVEREALSRFDDFFDTVSEQIHWSAVTPEELHAIPLWQELMSKAKVTLSKLEGALASQQSDEPGDL
jgi:hypothetical protein